MHVGLFYPIYDEGETGDVVNWGVMFYPQQGEQAEYEEPGNPKSICARKVAL